MPEWLRKHQDSPSHIHLLYSKEEPTYKEHIVYLIKDLKDNRIPCIEIVEHFSSHNDVGSFFSAYIKKEFLETFEHKDIDNQILE